jgi:hypothetical protein
MMERGAGRKTGRLEVFPSPPNIYSSRVFRTHPRPRSFGDWAQGPWQDWRGVPENGCCQAGWRGDKALTSGGLQPVPDSPPNENLLSRYQASPEETSSV